MAARGTPSLPTQLHHTQQHNTPSALLQRLRGPLTELVQCGVCLNTMAAAHAFPCSHAICGLCAVEWMRRRPSCPTCRAPAEFSQAVPVPTLDALADALAPLLAAEERDDLMARRGAWHVFAAARAQLDRARPLTYHEFTLLTVLGEAEGPAPPEPLSRRRGAERMQRASAA